MGRVKCDADFLRFAPYYGASLSIVGCLAVVWVIYRNRELRQLLFYRQLLCLCIADIFASVSWFFQREDAGWRCVWIGAIFEHYFYLCSGFWGAALATTLFLTTVKRVRVSTMGRFEQIAHCVCWITPLVLTASVQYLDWFGNVCVGCWISLRHSGWSLEQRRLIAWAVFGLWVQICWFYSVILLVSVISAIRGLQQTERPLLVEETQSPVVSPQGKAQLRVGACILVSLVVWGTIWVNEVCSWISVSSDRTANFTYHMLVLLVPSQGFLHAIVYGLFNERVQASLPSWLSRRKAVRPETAQSRQDGVDTRLILDVPLRLSNVAELAVRAP